MSERLQKIMAHAGIASRRECEKLIKAGQVRVNGRVARLGDKANPGSDRIEVKGRVLKLRHIEKVYVALNKPKGVISSLDDELGVGRTTVRDLVPLPGHLYPVGRLDKQSEGLMLMTNDGDMAHKLTHPRYGHTKTYRVTINSPIPPDTLDNWRRGIYLDGKKTAPAEVTVIRQETGFALLEIVMREGRKRQIRRVANILGYPVTKLVRTKIGPISLGSLKSGDWRHLQEQEVNALKQAVAQKKGRKPSQKKKRYQKRKGN